MAQKFLTGVEIEGTLDLNSVSVDNSTSSALVLASDNEVAKRTLGSAAFSAAGDFASSSHNHDSTYLKLAGGTLTGNVKFNDSVELRLGSGADLKAYHSGAHTYFDNLVGNLYIRNQANDKDVVFQSDNGSGGIQNYIQLDGSAKTVVFGDEINVQYDAISANNSGTIVRGGFLNPAAEANPVHVPWIINDLAGFDKWGTITTSGLYKTRTGSSGSYTYSNEVQANDGNWVNAFDSLSSTAGSWYSNNGADGTTAGTGTITLEWTNELHYTAYVGIVFGSDSFTAQRVKIECYRGGAWQTECNLTNNTQNVVVRQIASNSGTNAATTKIRFTLGGSVNGSYFRIHTLWASNYRAGDNNLANLGYSQTRGLSFIEKYRSSYIWGHFSPGESGSYDLGTSSQGWKDLFFKATAPVIHANSTNGGSGLRVDVTGLDYSSSDLFRLQYSGTTVWTTKRNGETFFTNKINVGTDGAGKDAVFYGGASGEKMYWDASESHLTINHDTGDEGLAVYPVSSQSPTAPQIKIGRDSGQYWGAYVTDSVAHLIHRQDETGGSDHFTKFQIWTNATGSHSWEWVLANNAGGNPLQKMKLSDAGVLTLGGGTNTITNAKVPNWDDAYTHSQATHAPSNAEANVQADWSVTDEADDAFIQNKPTIPTDHGDHDGLYLPIGGGTLSGTLSIESTFPRINLTDTNHDDDWSIINNNGQFGIYNVTDAIYAFRIGADNNSVLKGNLLPDADSTYDIGSNSSKWAEGHFDHLYVGETGNNPRIDIYTEGSDSPIADTFAQDTQKSYIYFNAGSGSNDPGYIMHETTGFPEDNEGVLHLCPSDDNGTGDYVSIHGTNDSDVIKLHTSGLIETANLQLQLKSGLNDVKVDDNLQVTGNISVTGTVDGVDISALPTSFAPTDAEANVQADWNATSGDAFIQNKPSIPADHGDHDGLYIPVGGGQFSGALDFTPDTGSILKVDNQTIIERTTANGGLTIGHDDSIILAGGDTSGTMNSNITNASETIFIGAEGGLKVYSFPGNMTGGWAGRKEWTFDNMGITTFPGSTSVGAHKYTLTVNAPSGLTTTIVNSTINVTFTASTTTSIDYYLVFSSVDGGDYGLISVIPPADFGATMSIIDDSFDATGTQAYRVYAVKNGVYSSPLTGSKDYSVTTPLEPTNMSVVNLNSAYYVQWDPPSTNARFVTAYNVYKHEHATQGSLDRDSATLIYSGLNTSYMYQISGANNGNFHQFWVETTIA